jgi:hypothetical protein
MAVKTRQGAIEQGVGMVAAVMAVHAVSRSVDGLPRRSRAARCVAFGLVTVRMAVMALRGEVGRGRLRNGLAVMIGRNMTRKGMVRRSGIDSVGSDTMR